jgi:hypothetical protein
MIDAVYQKIHSGHKKLNNLLSIKFQAIKKAPAYAAGDLLEDTRGGVRVSAAT